MNRFEAILRHKIRKAKKPAAFPNLSTNQRSREKNQNKSLHALKRPRGLDGAFLEKKTPEYKILKLGYYFGCYRVSKLRRGLHILRLNLSDYKSCVDELNGFQVPKKADPAQQSTDAVAQGPIQGQVQQQPETEENETDRFNFECFLALENSDTDQSDQSSNMFDN